MTQQSNFEKVREFSRSFEVPHFDSQQINIFTDNPDLVKLRLSLIKEEVGELEDAIRDHDMVEVVDALADILYVVYGAADSFGIDIDKAFNIVHSSNMSKLCRGEEEAQETVEWYQREFREGRKPYDSPYYYRGELGQWIIKNRSTGKVLKSINYTPADLREVSGVFTQQNTSQENSSQHS